MIKQFLKKLILKEKYSTNTFVQFLRKKGVSIGKGTKFIDPKNSTIDLTRPFLIDIGNECTFSDHVTILTHDYSWSVVAKKWHKEIYPVLGKVHIGDNCFIGSHATILCGCSLGNNVIVGAGSIVTKSFSDDVVIAGSPARIICTLSEYKEKISKLGNQNFDLLKKAYFDKYQTEIPESLLYEYLPYYCSTEQIKKSNPDYYDKYLS